MLTWSRTVKGWPRKTQLVAAGGVAVVVLLASLAALPRRRRPEPTRPTRHRPRSRPAAPAPAFAMQEHNGRGVTVNVPKGWKQAAPPASTSTTPTRTDSGRKVRILVEKSGTDDPAKFGGDGRERAEDQTSSSCAKPYNQLGLTDDGAGRQARAELEYTCGAGDASGTASGAGVVQDGKAYSFYLTATGRPVRGEQADLRRDGASRSSSPTPAESAGDAGVATAAVLSTGDGGGHD